MGEETKKQFGEVIRQARRDVRPPMSLRKFADKVGMAPAYLSKIEVNQDRPPSADKVEKMAEILGLDKFELLKLANRVPTELAEAFHKDARAPEFMRVAMDSGLTPVQLQELIDKNKAKKPK